MSEFSVAAEQIETAYIVRGQARLFALEQAGVDLLLKIDDGEAIFYIDHPLGPTGPELFLLGPFASDREIRITAGSKAGNKPFRIVTRSFPIDPDSNAYQQLVSLNQAGSLNHEGAAEAQKQIVSLYAQLRQSRVLSDVDEAFNYFADYLEASARQQLFDLDGAMNLLGDIPKQACVVAPYCYKPALLQASIRFTQNFYDESVMTMSALVADMARSGISEDTEADMSRLKSMLGIAYLFIKQPDYTKARQTLDESLEIAEKLEHPGLLGSIHNALGTYFFFADNNSINTIEHLGKAADYFARTDEERNLVYALSNLTETYLKVGEYDLSQRTARRTLEIVENSADRSLDREIYSRLGRLNLIVGDYTRAEYFVRLMVERDRENCIEKKLNNSRVILGQVQRAKGDIRGAISTHSEVLRHMLDGAASDYCFDASQIDREDLAVRTRKVHYELGIDYLNANMLEEAGDHFGMAFQDEDGEILSRSPDGMANRADLLIREGRYMEAVTLLETASTNTAATYAEKIHITGLMMRAHQLRGNTGSAIAAGREAVRLAGDIQGQLETYRMGPAWSARTNDIYKRLAGIMLSDYYRTGDITHAEQAFLVVEQSRARSLIQQRSASVQANSPVDTRTVNLRRQLTEISRIRAATDVDSPAYNEVSQRFFRILEQYQASLDLPRDFRQAEELTVSEALARVPRDSVAIEFLCIPDENCHVFVLQDDSLSVEDIGSYSQVSLLVNAATTEFRSLEFGDRPGIQALGKTLFEKLMRREGVTGKSDLMVVLDYPINRIPLAGLPLPGADGNRFLIDQFSIRNLPSLRAFRSQAGEREFEVELAVLADPVFSGESIMLAGEVEDNFRGWVDNLERLPWSAREAENLKNIYSNENIRVFTGQEANRKNLLDTQTRQARILHIASHAYFNPGMSDLVGIAFSSEAGDAGPEGDFVTLNEILNSQFDSELVVISGCETGQGEYLPGEGTMSLARGFLAQGVDHVISTLWPVSDRMSAEFMKRFYEALHQQGLPVERALQSAQRQLSSQNLAYWAPYVLTSVSN